MNHPDPDSQHRHLVKHFFWRFFDLEAISTPQIDPVQKNALKIRILADTGVSRRGGVPFVVPQIRLSQILATAH